MQVAGHELLAGAVRPGDEHAGVRRGDFVYHLPDMQHRSRLAYHVRAIDPLFQYLVLAGKSLALGGVLDGDEYAVEVERLLHEVERPLLDALHGSVDVTMSGNHHHGSVHAHLHEFVQHLDAVHTWHLDVAEYHVELFLLDFGYGGSPVFGDVGIIAFICKYLLERVADSSLVIYYKYSHFTIIVNLPGPRWQGPPAG